MPAVRRVLLITRNFPPAHGGIETMALELARHADAAGVEIVVAHFGQTPCRDLPGLAYRHLPGSGRGIALLLSAFAIPLLALRLRPSLIVNMQVTTAPGSLLANVLLGFPFKIIGLGLELLPPRRLSPAFSYRAWVLRAAREVISISRFTDSLVARFGVPAERRRVINPGTRAWPSLSPDPEAAFGPTPPGAFLCLTLARLVPRKGVDTALKALSLVLPRRRDVFYCVGGEGPDRPRLESLAAELGLAGHVRFLGRVPEEKLGLCYASADVFILPSRSSENPPDAEGFGIVFLEAGACGTPSLGGNSGGIPDAIEDGITGCLVDPGDPADLAEKLLRLMENRSRLEAMGLAAKAKAADSTWERVAAAYWAAILSGR